MQQARLAAGRPLAFAPAAPGRVARAQPRGLRRHPAVDQQNPETQKQQQLATAGTEFVEAQLVGKYTYSSCQLEVIEDFTKNMRSCGVAFAAVAVGNIALSVYQAQSHGFEVPEAIVGGLSVGDLAYWGDSVLLWYLIRVGEGPFDQVMVDTDNQLAHTFQGVNRLTLVFQQLGIASITVAIVSTLEAAAKWPPMVVAASSTFFGFAVLRSAAMWWVLNKHTGTLDDVRGTLRKMARNETPLPWLDQLAVRVAFGYLSSLSLPQAKERKGSSSGGQELPEGAGEKYAFGQAEEQLLRSMTEAATNAGVALGLQALATFMLVVANLCVEDWSDAVSSGINAVNKTAAAAFIFQAAASFDQTLYADPDDCDIQHFLMGLGEGGLTSTFEKLTVLAWAVAFAEAASLAAPWLEHSPLSTLVTEGAAERLADKWVELLRALV